jgi:NhaP-type Na+/H+ or K+/H+ antiporter
LDFSTGLAAIVLLGATAQWLGWRFRLPSILLLLVFGFVAGPAALGIVDADGMLGKLLAPVVSLGVAILLFEGSLTLHLRELGDARGVVGRLLTLGTAVTWTLAAAAAWLLLDFEPALAVLTGAILTVTGPTVVLPILRQVRPTGPAGSILKWEGILIDPVGAVLAVLVFEAIQHGTGFRPSFVHALGGIGRTLLVGGVAGALGAGALYEMLRRYWIPDHLHAAIALAFAVAAHSLANAAQHEAGLLAVTVMGALLANQRRVPLRHILEFKENLQVLVISSLFILLAARLT